MRTLKLVVVLFTVVLSVACATKSRPTVAPPHSAGEETLPEQITRLKTEEAKRIADVSPEERAIRLRAQEIEHEESEKRALKERAKHESPAMKKARAEFAKATKVREAMAEAIFLADVSGCPSGAVWVHPKAVRLNWFESRLGYINSIRIINESRTVTYDIQTSSRGIGVAVRDLCPGGSVSLRFVKDGSLREYQNETIVLVAKSQPSSSQRTITEERWITLQGGRWGSPTSQGWFLRQ